MTVSVYLSVRCPCQWWRWRPQKEIIFFIVFLQFIDTTKEEVAKQKRLQIDIFIVTFRMRKQMEISEIDGRLNEEYDRKLQEQLNVRTFLESDYSD